MRGKTKQEAEKRLAELISRLEHGEVGISMNMQADRWADEWLETYIKPRVRKPGESKLRGTMTEKSYGNYEVKIRKYIKPALKGLELRQVKDIHLQKLLNSQADKSYSHVAFLRVILRGMFSQATASRIIPFDPSLTLTLPAAKKGKRRSLTPKERLAFDMVCADKDFKQGMWFSFLINTGLRPAESICLQVKDLDFKQKLVYVNKAVESGTNVVSTPKTDAAYRHVPIPDSIIAELKRHVEGKALEDLVFPQVTRPDKMLTQICIKRYWQSLYNRMDIAMGAPHTGNNHVTRHIIADDLCLYCLRHTYCTNLQAAGVPINIARYLMGHSDISVTANIYTHTGISEALAAVDLINAL